MQRFFFEDEQILDQTFKVTGEKYNHIINSLRMSVGETAIFCDGHGIDYECSLINIDQKSADFKIIESFPNKTEPSLKITIFQCLTKGDKMDEMVKRCVQFGAYQIVPVISNRCVSRPDKKSSAKKIERYNKIARSSAMQSMRGVIPIVSEFVDFKCAISKMTEFSSAFICYENERNNIINSSLLSKDNIAFLIGPEGGLDQSEVDYAKCNGVGSVSLGKRILRTEDAASFLIPILLLLTDNL